MKLLENKNGMVVGATSGIGKAAALLFAQEGASVAIVGRRTGLLEEVCSEISRAGGRAITITADVSRSQDVQRMVKEAKDALGSLDFAFNNAGTIGNFSPMLQQTEKDWDDTINTNLKSVWLSLKAQAEAMKNSGGAIVNTSSWLAIGALEGSTTYSASKAGMDGLVRAAALELSSIGIRVNNINPGGIDTEMTREALQYDEQNLSAFAHAHPLKRLGTSSEVAQLAAFLLSDRASNITGQSMLVDGGYAIAGQRG